MVRFKNLFHNFFHLRPIPFLLLEAFRNVSDLKMTTLFRKCRKIRESVLESAFSNIPVIIFF